MCIASRWATLAIHMPCKNVGLRLVTFRCHGPGLQLALKDTLLKARVLPGLSGARAKLGAFGWSALGRSEGLATICEPEKAFKQGSVASECKPVWRAPPSVEEDACLESGSDREKNVGATTTVGAGLCSAKNGPRGCFH